MPERVRPRRAPPVRLAAMILSAACLTAVTSGTAAGDEPAARAGDRPHRWSGYAIRATGDAAGGWIGGYRVGETTLYVVTPTKNPNRAGFEAPRAVDDVAGRATSQSETERAAWILSKYGGYRDATQAAAVDASVYHLLVGGRWKVGSPRGARRIRQSGDAASVRRFARIMLRQSRASAGAYTARLDASGADLGGAVAVTLSVVDGHGRPAAGLPVTLAMAGAEPLTAVTGDDGRALGRFPANARGWQEVTATVDGVPDHRLHLWPAEKKGQAAAAEGGARRQVVASTAAPVRGPQTMSLRAEPGGPDRRWPGAGRRVGHRRRSGQVGDRRPVRSLRQHRRRPVRRRQRHGGRDGALGGRHLPDARGHAGRAAATTRGGSPSTGRTRACPSRTAERS